ncbi:hypothetical protein K466DRAFT_607447 [Polyporus arcularius HHB13444]|uniref:Uncharacterized protein n=1 Tax=Polyporus arcularius HHB13444 TaxID=1314778 RepID=A0A5C3NMQ9_9APHY|nr:hypothetical protein K466DRAFT_607447 [Polyporus arcularius HHB13444]
MDTGPSRGASPLASPSRSLIPIALHVEFALVCIPGLASEVPARPSMASGQADVVLRIPIPQAGLVLLRSRRRRC